MDLTCTAEAANTEFWVPPRDEECDPSLDNGVPCSCMFIYEMIFASTELILFFGALLILFYKSIKRKKKIVLRTGLLIVFFSLAFVIRFSYVVWAYSGPNNCRSMITGISFWAFAPQAIFFLIFIWAIFKLLVIWRVMVSNTPDEA